MNASFSYRGVTYLVSGWLWSADGAGNGISVSREDGRAIRGARFAPGMIQIGLSRGLTRLAERALESEHDASKAVRS